MVNPFEFGRELNPTELVDRTDEVRAVAGAMGEGGRLFLIGPRRFGKTSILRAAAERARGEGVVVLRYNAEAYPSLPLLVRALVEGAAGALTGSVRKAGQKIQEAFGTLRPQVSYNPLDQSFSATLGAAGAGVTDEVLLVEALDGLDRLAGASGKRVALVIDEFQQVVERGGVEAEGQVRAAVQRHEHVAYVFAGSKTAMLSEMTGNPDRPFYRLGARLFVGPVPRDDFRPFLQGGLASAGVAVEPEAVEALLDMAEDVPYNVQRLAHECWTTARRRAESGEERPVTDADVQDELERLVSRDDPFYTQTWNRLTAAQQNALLAVVATDGTGLYSRPVLKRFGLPMSTMRTSLEALVRVGVSREEEAREEACGTDWRIRSSAAWLRLFVTSP